MKTQGLTVAQMNHRLRLCWRGTRRVARDRNGKPFDRGGYPEGYTKTAWDAAAAITRNLMEANRGVQL